jgi:hypothetical protein
MKTHVFLAWFAVFCYTYASNAVPTKGYSKAEVAAMDKLVVDSTEPKDWLTQLTERKR